MDVGPLPSSSSRVKPDHGDWLVLTRCARRALCVLLSLALFGGATTHAHSEEPELASRILAVLGLNLMQPEPYLEIAFERHAPYVPTIEDYARIPGLPARQHPVAAFDPSCGQCHRVAGPLPPTVTVPQDVFQQLPLARIEKPVPEGFTRLTDSHQRQEYPSWSPDGSMILFEVASDEGRYNLWLMNADGRGQRQLTGHAAAGWGVWHPDGRRIAYWAAESDGSANLWLVDTASTAASRQLTHHQMTAWPRWSPDGRHIAYQARDDDHWRLHLLELDDGLTRDITQPGDDLPSRPLWSPDGSEVLYQSLIGTRFELTRLRFPLDASGDPDFDATPTRSLIATEYPIDLGTATQHPAWRPDGQHIAFVMYTLESVPVGGLVLSYKTWIATTDGQHPVRLTPETTIADRSPTWSSDGAWLAQWSWDRHMRAGIWLIDAHATNQIELTASLGGEALYPAWSPDGTTIAFTSNREGSFDIWLADVAHLAGLATP